MRKTDDTRSPIEVHLDLMADIPGFGGLTIEEKMDCASVAMDLETFVLKTRGSYGPHSLQLIFRLAASALLAGEGFVPSYHL